MKNQPIQTQPNNATIMLHDAIRLWYLIVFQDEKWHYRAIKMNPQYREYSETKLRKEAQIWNRTCQILFWDCINGGLSKQPTDKPKI